MGPLKSRTCGVSTLHSTIAYLSTFHERSKAKPEVASMVDRKILIHGSPRGTADIAIYDIFPISYARDSPRAHMLYETWIRIANRIQVPLPGCHPLARSQIPDLRIFLVLWYGLRWDRGNPFFAKGNRLFSIHLSVGRILNAIIYLSQYQKKNIKINKMRSWLVYFVIGNNITRIIVSLLVILWANS